MAALTIHCKKCRKEARIDPLAILEGAGVVLADCTCGFLARSAALLEAAMLCAAEGSSEEAKAN